MIANLDFGCLCALNADAPNRLTWLANILPVRLATE
jgi:hypothetical protein